MDIEQVEITSEQLALDRQFLEACQALDEESIKSLIDQGCDTWFQDPESGKGPLHYIVDSAAAASTSASESSAVEILNYLLSNGAVWNQMSKSNETPGCTARRLFSSTSRVYQTLLNAGIRAELLLTALDKQSGSHDPSERNAAFLSGKLEYTEPTAGKLTLLDDDHNAVMMTWEHEIMRESARVIMPEEDRGTILNIGFGLGLIDSEIQKRRPKRHVIIEAHPDVLAEMKRTGWYERPNVQVIEGRWQDVVDQLANEETFDGIYYDPFEYWEDMHQFFDAVVALLNPDGIFSFFHGLGADNQTFYDVYTNILEIELSDFGLQTRFRELDVETVDEEWTGAKRRYWSLHKYRLPTCRFIQ